MKYDFTTVVNRYEQGSEKWIAMKRRVPDLEDDIVPFSVADMEFLPMPQIVTGLTGYLKNGVVLGYTIPTDEYLNTVADWMNRRHSWQIERDWICVSNGVIPAIYDFVKAYAEEGDGVILMTPVYYPFYKAITANGRKVKACPLVNRQDSYQIDFELLEKLTAMPENKLLIFCSPHNPIGKVWSREELTRVAEICIRNDVVIISDEIHNDLIMPGFTHTVMASLNETIADHVITCTAPSKTFNLAGMMASNIIIKNPELRKKFRKEQGKSGFDCMSVLGYKACQLAYTFGDQWLEELLQVIQHNYNRLKEYLQENLPEVKVYPLEGTYLVWMDFSGLGMNHEELETFMVEKAHVFMDEGYIFGHEGECFERMNIACPTEVMMDGLKRIVKAWRAQEKDA